MKRPLSNQTLIGSPGGFDAFAVKLALASTFILGGSLPGGVNGVAVDASGIYVTGGTQSLDFPVTPGVFQPAFLTTRTRNNAFNTKIKPGGSGLPYSLTPLLEFEIAAPSDSGRKAD